MKKEELALKIDQTLLRSDATFDELEKFVKENKEIGFYSLCVPSFFVKRAKEIVDNVCRISTVVGFPTGNSSTSVKVYEATQAVAQGAECIDAVINVNAVKSGDYNYIKDELETLRYSVDMYGKCELRIIIEACLLTNDEKKAVAELIAQTKCDAVKTSTGFSSGGATAEDVALLKSVVRNEIKIKAAGGIKDIHVANAMFAAGADLIGTSAGVQLLASCENE